MHERRRDPRTSKPYSLRNLLRTRAESEGFLLAVVATHEGHVMASSRDMTDDQGARIAAHASKELFGGGGCPSFTRASSAWPSVRLLALRIEVDGQPALVAVLVPTEAVSSLQELATAVQRILREPAREDALAA
jgi:hypothetical protein